MGGGVPRRSPSTATAPSPSARRATRRRAAATPTRTCSSSPPTAAAARSPSGSSSSGSHAAQLSSGADRLEPQLRAAAGGNARRVLAREAGAADRALGQPRRRLHARRARGSGARSRRCARASPRPSGGTLPARPRRPCRSRRSTATRPAARRSGRAPRRRRASKSIAMSCCIVLPRTIESSTITTRLPATSSSGLNLSRIPCRRSSWSGWMNVRPT